MKIAGVVVAACLLALAGAAEGQALKQRKPGLWEIQYSGEDSESKARQAQTAERLRNMPPEKRAQMQEPVQASQGKRRLHDEGPDAIRQRDAHHRAL